MTPDNQLAFYGRDDFLDLLTDIAEAGLIGGTDWNVITVDGVRQIGVRPSGNKKIYQLIASGSARFTPEARIWAEEQLKNESWKNTNAYDDSNPLHLEDDGKGPYFECPCGDEGCGRVYLSDIQHPN